MFLRNLVHYTISDSYWIKYQKNNIYKLIQPVSLQGKSLGVEESYKSALNKKLFLLKHCFVTNIQM